MRLILIGVVLVAGCSSGSGEGSPAPTNAAGICGKLVALACSGYTTSTCEAAIAKSRQSAEESGCVAEYEKALSCTAANLPTCDNGKLTANQACIPDALAYAACDPSAVCIRSTSSTGCSYSCGDTAMECEGSGTAWSCSCTQGPKTGQTFTLNDYSEPCDRTPLESYCE